MKRVTLILFNLLLLVISVAVIFAYLYFPLFQVKMQYAMGAEDVQYIVDQYGDQLGDYGDIDVYSIIGEEKYTLSVTVTIAPMSLINSVIDNDTEAFITDLIMDTVEPFIDDLADILVKVISSVATTQVTSIAKDYLTDYLNSNLSEEEQLSTEEIQQILDDAGLTDEYIDEQVNTVIGALTAEDATVDSITETVMDVVEDVIATAKESDDFADIELDDESRQEIEDQVKEVLEQMADEDGSVTIDALLAMALQYLNGDENGEGALVGTYSTVNSIRVMDSSTSTETSETKAQLTEKITEIVMGYIDDVIEIVNYVVLGLAILLLFSCFTWLYIILKIIFKIFCKNPGIKLKLPIWLGWIPFTLFYAAPTIVMMILPNFIEELGTTFVTLYNSLAITFSTSGLYAFVAAVALFVIWIPYHILRKRRKRELMAIANGGRQYANNSSNNAAYKVSSDSNNPSNIQISITLPGNDKSHGKSKKHYYYVDDDDDLD